MAVIDNFVHTLLAEKPAEAVALFFGSESTTYGELRALVERYASALIGAGLKAGDRAVMLADNSLFAVSAYLGVMRAGGVIVPLAPAAGEAATAHQLRATGAKLGFVQKKYVRRFAPTVAAQALEQVWVDGAGPALPGGWATVDAFEHSKTVELPPQVDGEALASIVFTSGSTGTPRGVMVLHRNLIANTRSICHYLPMGTSDRAMLVLPLCYCYGASVLHTHLWSGGAVVLSPGFMFPEQVLGDLERHGCTAFYGVPSTYQLLLRKSTFSQRELPTMRYFAQAGGRLPNPFIEEIQQAFPRVPFYTMYGQTEATARLSYLPAEQLNAKRGSIGRGIPGTTLHLLNPEGLAVSPGEVGEIVAEGENITAGYWQDPESTATYFRDGKLWTGDLATCDKEGYLYIKDRKRDFIKVGGVRVSSKEVEDTIAELESVVEVAVVGVPDEVLGEAITAVIVPTAADALDRDAVAKHCRLRLHGEKVPKEILVVARLPKNTSGKILKSELRRQLEAGELA